MAKWGEGDERWIVSERQDGANVNGWHWQEKNCMGWGRERLSALLETVVFELDAGTAQVKEISKFDGDASVTIRKGDKKFAVFDLSVTCKWEGEMEGVDGAVKGEIKLTEFASTNDEDEYDSRFDSDPIDVHVAKGDEGNYLRQFGTEGEEDGQFKSPDSLASTRTATSSSSTSAPAGCRSSTRRASTCAPTATLAWRQMATRASPGARAGSWRWLGWRTGRRARCARGWLESRSWTAGMGLI